MRPVTESNWTPPCHNGAWPALRRSRPLNQHKSKLDERSGKSWSFRSFAVVSTCHSLSTEVLTHSLTWDGLGQV